MKKLREWFKIRRNVISVMNGCFGAAIGMFGTAALTAPYSWLTVINAFIAGFYSALIIANHFLERARESNERLIEIAENQQSMIQQIVDQKAGEIAAELANVMNGEVSIVPRSRPTKH